MKSINKEKIEKMVDEMIKISKENKLDIEEFISLDRRYLINNFQYSEFNSSDIKEMIQKLYGDFLPDENEETFKPSKLELDSSNYTCPNCKSDKIETDIKQTRSADEGATLIRICTKCNKRF